MAGREKDKALLVEQAAELYLLGLKIQGERRLIEEYKKARQHDHPDMAAARTRLESSARRWVEMEAEHLLLRRKLGLE